ncbi:MAG: ROK family protein [Firmicutes bacterium]|nr:ROK family protein [Bacillota bacterium]
MHSGNYILGIDLGGTKIAGAILSRSGQAAARRERPTNAHEGPEQIYTNVLQLINTLSADAEIPVSQLEGIGIGVPGVVTSEGAVEWAPALRWKDFPLARRLEEDLKARVIVENDVRLQALGEYRFGAARGADPMVYLAIGTGLGSGIIINGRIHLGCHRTAGEVSNMVVDRSQLGKTFGGFGGLELYASGAGLARLFSELYPNHPAVQPGITGAHVCAMAADGVSEALAVLQEFAHYLALAVVNLAVTIDPELIVLGGGVAQAANLFLPQVIELTRPVVPALPRIVVSKLGTLTGPLGALALLTSTASQRPAGPGTAREQ